MRKHFFVAMALLSLGVTSCKDDITFDQEAYDDLVNKAFPVENVDPNHQWATVSVASTNIAINTGTGDTYRVKIYDQNPIGYDGTLTLLGEGRIADGDALNMSISYPLAQPWAYVTLFNSQNYMSVYPALIKDGQLDVNISTNTAKARKRAIQCSFTFPDDADASKFLDDVPAGVAKLTQNAGRCNNYIDETWQGDLNIWGEWDGSKSSGGTLYVKGNCNFSNRSFYFAGNSELYLVKGATLTLNEYNGSGNLQTNTKIYIAEGAKLVAKGELKLNNGLQIYNHGTIETNKLSTNSNSVLVNGGTVTVNTKISVENTLSVIVNNGTITATDMNTAGSGKFQNNNKVTISETTFVNSNDNAWVNNGEFHTGNFIYNAGSNDVINNCKMIVDEDFNINLGDNSGNGCFKMDAGSSVVTKYFNGGGNWAKSYSTGWSASNGGPFYIYMGAGSLFDVTETATMNATKADYGVYGPSEGNFAVFRAKKIVAGAANQGYEVTYGGNLYVATDNHFPNGLSGTYPYIDIKGAAGLTSYNGANVTFTGSGCGAAYVGKPNSGKPSESPMAYRYCFEDNFPTVGDYDFNDVVLTVTPSLDFDRTVTIKVTLDAVGATETVAAAIRFDGINSNDLEDYKVIEAFPSVDGNGQGTYHNIEHSDGFVREGEEPNLTNDLVIVLFRDAHWAINPQKLSDGSVEHIFFNTVKPGDYYERNVTPPTATYKLVFRDAEKAKKMLAEDLYDVFIVEPYNGGYWEVHTVQNNFKTVQVITPQKPEPGYTEAYGKGKSGNRPWAIMVPGNFKYPIEWQAIGKKTGQEITGAYKEQGHSFGEWAENSSNATDWYKYPTAGLVYEK